MDYIVLGNGVKMQQLGYGVYQVTKVDNDSQKELLLAWQNVTNVVKSCERGDK